MDTVLPCVQHNFVFSPLKIVLFNSEGLCNPDVSHSPNILMPGEDLDERELVLDLSIFIIL